MKSKKLFNQIIKTFKKWFCVVRARCFNNSEYIIQRSGEKFKNSMLSFENEDGKLCLRPDLTVASCIKYLQKLTLKYIIQVLIEDS